MNEVSIIINGVRYDAVEGDGCSNCKLKSFCDICIVEFCVILGAYGKIFKKSDKKFER
jgi:hypothetical protein